jgi:small subunit ribosomal protein S3
MAKKVNPKIFRMGVTEKCASNWYAGKKEFAVYLHQDIKVRKVVNKLAKPAGIDKIVISRSSNNVLVDLFVGRPGIAIGKGGSGIEMLEKAIAADAGEKVKISVHEVKQPYLSAPLVANAVSEGIARRIPPKVVMRQQIDKIEASGAKGARIEVAGIGPIKQSRTERVELKGGKVPLTTIRAKIDYGTAQILSDKMYGIKVWIYKGEL